MTLFFPQKMVPECNPEWNRETIAFFSRLPSLRRLQATPTLQTDLSMDGPLFQKFKKQNQSYQSKTNGNDSYLQYLPTYMDIARNLLINTS